MSFYYVRAWDGTSSITETDTRPTVFQSCAGGYDTREELIEACKIQPFSCSECGQIFGANYMETVATEMIRDKLCFNCHFWRGYVLGKDNPKYARIGGQHYCVNPIATGEKRWLGFGGRKSRVRWFDGREQETNDLWYQGQIPDHFKERIPDNAEFVQQTS